MIRILYRSGSGEMISDLPIASLDQALQDDHGLLWIDFLEEDPAICAPILRDTFGFHPLAIEDALVETHNPKVDDWDTYLYLVLNAVQFEEASAEPLQALELDVFLGANYLVTHQATAIPAVEKVWSLCIRDERQLQRGSARLLYRVIDELVSDYMPVIEQIDDALDEMEDQVFDNPEQDLLQRIFRLKRAVPQLRRILSPQREVLNKIAREGDSVLSDEDRVYFRDIYDHLVRMHDITEGLRDLVSSVLDTYLSVISNRMNDVMKTLTVITTLFMPLAFLTGFFGMNFFQPSLIIPAWTGNFAFIALLITIVLLPAIMFLWMRRRAWM
ncbi:MAG: magnesium/cobalt transporter CorA [Anaerolineales bacterium]|nr:magnesium/cobalt transporter CorA [Anaerolineales bacterium]